MQFSFTNSRLICAATFGLGLVALVQGQSSVTDRLPDSAGYDAGFEHEGGQYVQPIFEGWQAARDGHFVMWFGYMNMNYDETPDVPVGQNNKLDLRDDMGQPTHFLPRRHWFVFKTDVPKDWDKQKRLVWTLNINGKTASANAWLQPEWEIDEGVMQMNIGPGGAPPENPSNEAPKISTALKSEQAAEVGKPLKLTVSATDDGIPKPRRRPPPSPNANASKAPILPPGGVATPRATLGFRIRWELYRAPVRGGEVSFSPETMPPTVGATTAELSSDLTFSAPGTYWLRAVASDGMLETPYDVKVNVTGSARR